MTLEHGREEVAAAAGLRYSTDDEPGIRRVRAGRGFRYLGPDGGRLTDEVTLARIRWLAVPPAWREVWICRDAGGHLQATGRDARGRKQHRYHPEWRRVRNAMKHERLMEFGRALPRIRRRVRRDLGRRGIPREKVLALVVGLLERTLLRVGNEEYVRSNGSFGLTTLRGRHVTAGSTRVRFRFRGKSGKVAEAVVSDRRVARAIGRLQELPGQELLQYLDDDGELRAIGSADVNDYLREIAGDDFTAKDFRTWAGSVIAARALRELPEVDGAGAARRNVVRAVREVAASLGNTPAVSRSAYIHPGLIDAYLEGETIAGGSTGTGGDAWRPPVASLAADERAVMDLLRTRLGKARRRAAARRRGPRGRGQAASSRASARR